MTTRKFRVVRWLVPLAAVAAFGLGACDHADDATPNDEDVVTAGSSSAGDQQQASQADAAERHAKLANAAELYGADSGPNPFEAGNRAVAEATGQSVPPDPPVQPDQRDHQGDEFVPGTRHMPSA